MNAPFVVAQAIAAGETATSGQNAAPPAPPRILKLEKPQGDQALVVQMDGQTKLDFTAIQGEQITLVRAGERLVILFDNRSTISIEPFFDAGGLPLKIGAIELEGNRLMTGEEFASIFPISNDQSILPAAAQGPQGSSGSFGAYSIDGLSEIAPIALLGNEEGSTAFEFSFNQILLDGPVIAPTAGDFMLALDEDGLPGGNPGGLGDPMLLSPENVASGILPHTFGNGGPGSLSFAAMDGTSETIGGVQYDFVWDGATGTLTISTGGKAVIEVTLDPATGAFTATLVGALTHAAAGTEDDLLFNLTYTVTSITGSTTGTLALNINDDMPEIGGPFENGAQRDFTLDEDDLLGGNDGRFPDTNQHDQTKLIDKPLGISWGADDGATRDLQFTTASAPSGLTSHHAPVSYAVSADGHTLIAYTGADAGDASSHVFKVTLDPAAPGGAYTFELLGSLDHANGEGENSLALTFDFTATDGDGDPMSSSFVIRVVDDIPTVAVDLSENKLLFDESPLAQGDANDLSGPVANIVAALFSAVLVPNRGNDPDTLGLPLGFARSAGAMVTVDAHYGADDQGAAPVYAFELGGAGSGVDSGLKTTDGQTIYLYLQGNGVVVGRVGDANGDAAFALHVNAQTGVVSLAEWLSIQHDDKADANDIMSLAKGALLVKVTVTDGDGDTASATADISGNVAFRDDGPSLIGQLHRTHNVDEGDIATSLSTGTSPHDGRGDGSVTGGPTDQTQGPAYVSGSLASLVFFGVDGQAAGGGFGFTQDAAATMTALGLQSKHVDVVWQVNGNALEGVAGNRVVATFTLNSNGTYSYRQFDQLDHVAPPQGTADHNTQLVGAGNAIDFGSVILATDGDGDSISLAGRLSITVVDDIPTVAVDLSQNKLLFDESLLAQGDANDLAGPVANIVAALFSAVLVPNRGNDPDTLGLPLGFARSAGAMVTVDAHYGADDQGAAPVYAFELGGAGSGVDSGLKTTDGQTIYLYLQGNGVVVGRVGDANGDAAFALHVNAQTGVVSLAEWLSIQHDDKADANDIMSLAKGALLVKVTVTDGDGDTATATADISGNVAFRDDGPSLTVIPRNHNLVLDETVGLKAGDANAGDEVGVGNNHPLVWASLTPIGMSKASASDLFIAVPLYGVDGPGGTQYAFTVDTAVASSLKDTLTGKSIVLTHDASNATVDIVVGYLEGTTTPAFVMLIDRASGETAVWQYRALEHPNQGSDDEFVTIATGAVGIAVTVFDGDGDSASRIFDLGSHVRFEDDGPSLVSALTFAFDEGDILNLQSQGSSANDGDADGSSTDLLGAVRAGSIAAAVSFGSDGPAAGGGFGFTANAPQTMGGLGLSSKGAALSYVLVGNTLIAYVNTAIGGYQPLIDRTIFSLELNGNGNFTFRMFDQLDHVNDGQNDKNTQLVGAGGALDGIDFGSVIKATDGDGDSVVLTGKFKIEITDDIPSVSITATGASTTIDETPGAQNNDTGAAGVAGQFNVSNPGSDPDIATPIYARNPLPVVAASSLLGSDEPHPVSLSLQIDASLADTNGLVDSGLRTTEGKIIYLFAEGGLIVGRYDADGNGITSGDPAAFAVAIDQLGRVSVAQYVSLQHPDNTQADESVDLGGTAAVPGDKIFAVATATDFDGDTVQSVVAIGAHIHFDDDAPFIDAAAIQNGFVDEERLPGGNSGDSYASGDLDDDGDLTASGSLGIRYGADGPAGLVVTSPTFSSINFDSFPQGGGGSPYHVGDYVITSNQGISNVGGNGQLYGTNVNITDTVAPFTIATLSLGLYGASNTGTGDVRLTGVPAGGGAAIVVVIEDVALTSLGSPIQSYDLSGTLLAGVLLSSLKIEPVTAVLPEQFNGSVMVDDISAGSGGGKVIDGPLVFTDQADAAANVMVAGQNGAIDLADLKSDGAPLQFKLLDAVTLVAYTGSEPSAIDASNVVFSVVLSGTGSGSYIFTLNNNLDHPLGGTEDDLVFTFDFTAKDSEGDRTNGSFKVTVDDDAPVGVSDAFSFDEDGSITGNVASNDHAGADGLRTSNPYQVVDGVSHGALTFNQQTGAFTYTPSANYNGQDQFTYTITDKDGDISQPVTVTLTVNPVNDAPVAPNYALHVSEDGQIDQSVLATDIDNDSDDLIYSLESTLQGLTFNDDGTWSYTPPASYQSLKAGESDTVSFQYRASDGAANSNLGTVTITIDGANDAPLANDDNFSTSESGVEAAAAASKILVGNVLTGAGADTDIDLDALSVSAVTAQLSTSADTAALGFTSFVITALAPAGGEAALYQIVTDFGSAYLSVSTNGDVHMWSASGDPFAALGVSESLPLTFAYEVSDGVLKDTATVAITVNGSNDATVVVADTNWVQEDTALSASGNVLHALAHAGAPSGSFADAADTDVDGDTLTVSTVNGIAGNVGVSIDGSYGKLVLNANGSYTYTLYTEAENAAAYQTVQALGEGSTPLIDSFDYTANDGTAASATSTLKVSVFGSNDTPELVFESSDKTVNESGLPGGSTQGIGHTATGYFTISDPDGISDIESVTINSVTVLIGDLLTAGPIAGEHGTLKITGYDSNTGRVDYIYTLTGATTDVAGTEETDTFTVSVSDGTVSTAGQTLTVTIVDDVPTAVADGPYSVAEDAVANVVSGNVLNNDASGADAPKTFVAWGGAADAAAITELSKYGTLVQGNDGSWSYTLDNGRVATQALNSAFSQAFVLHYTMKDADGDERPSTLTITVSGANDAPVAVNQVNDVTEDAVVNAVTGSLLAGATDADDDALHIQGVSFGGGAANTSGMIAGIYGTLTWDADTGAYTYTLDNDDADTQALNTGDTRHEVFEFTVSDGGLTSTKTLDVTVHGHTDVPVGPNPQNDTFTTNVIWNSIRIPFAALLANDGVALGSDVTITNVVGATVDGEYVVLPGAGAGTSSTFTYSLKNGSETIGPATVTVSRVNDFIHGTPDGDFLIQRNTGDPAVNGGSGDDVLLTMGTTTINGGEGNDYLFGLGGTNNLNGDAGDDVLFGGISGHYSTLNGGSGNDILYAGGRNGTTVMTGGSGADTFVFKDYSFGWNIGSITDYKASEGDLIDISELLQGYNSGTPASNWVKFEGGSLKVNQDGSGSDFVTLVSFSNNPDHLQVLLDATQTPVTV